jgi:hypothetical protein
MKLQSTRGLKNTTRILPTVGETAIDAEGQIDIEDTALANSLIETGNWTSLEEEEPEEIGEGVDEELEDEEEPEDNTPDVKALLDKMTLADMLKLAKESKVKGYEAHKGNAKALRAFLKTKL